MKRKNAVIGFFGSSNFVLLNVSVELKNPAFGSMTDDNGAFRDRLDMRQANEDIIMQSLISSSLVILRKFGPDYREFFLGRFALLFVVFVIFAEKTFLQFLGQYFGENVFEIK